MKDRLSKLRSWAEGNARECIFPFWTSDYIVDKENGGFYGRVTIDMEIDNSEPRGLTLAGRMTYAFSSAYRIFGDPIYRERATYAFRDLIDRFYDKQYGGAFVSVSAQGEVLVDTKPNYCEAFLIMGCAAYYRATGNEEALKVAMRTFQLMESKAKWAPSSYHNNMSRTWEPAEGNGFNPKPPKEGEEPPKKPMFYMPPGSVMFPHHLCQAYVQLYEATQDMAVGAALREMAEFIVNKLYDPQYRCFKTIVAADGSRVGTRQSFGHDCEISYLAMTVANLVGDEKLKADMRNVVTQVLEQVLSADFDPWGSLYNGGDLVTGDREKSHVWWAQAEAVTAMITGYQLTGNEEFLRACEKQADYIEKYFVNREHGDWYNNIVVDENGWANVDGMHGFDKLNGGKCPFHNSSMCFEVMARCDALLKEV